jgi:hypothetical protein
VFNGIEVRAIERPMKIAIRDGYGDPDCRDLFVSQLEEVLIAWKCDS